MSSSAARIWPVLSGSPRAGSSPENFTSSRTPSSAARVRNRSATSAARTERLKGLSSTPKIVSEMLGYASKAIFLNTYSHILPNMQDSAVAAMEEAFT